MPSALSRLDRNLWRPCTWYRHETLYVWEKILQTFERLEPSSAVARTDRSLDTKWQEINRDVIKFNGYYNQVVQMKKYGWNEADILEHAKEMYLHFYGGGTHLKKKNLFSYMNWWEYLRDKEKWRVVRVDAKRKTPSASASAQQDTGTELQVIQPGKQSASAHERPPVNIVERNSEARAAQR